MDSLKKEKMKIKSYIKKDDFITNNGRVMRMTDLFGPDYTKLRSIEVVLSDESVEQGEFLESVNFLVEEGYLKLRDITTKAAVPELCQDTDYRNLETKQTGKGKRLMRGNIIDELVEV